MWERDNRVDDLVYKLYKEIAPDSHAPIFEVSETAGFLEALRYTVPELHEELSSIFYDGLVFPQTLKFEGRGFYVKSERECKEYLLYRFIEKS